MQQFFTQTLKGHNSVTNKDTEVSQTSLESSICALFSRPAGFFIAGRQSTGAGRQPAEPALEKALNYIILPYIHIGQVSTLYNE